MAKASKSSGFNLRSYGDIVLALGVTAIMCLMVLRLPTPIIDALVAINISCGIALLLIAMCVQHPVAFNSFPSVLLITTLFRLSLSIATTRLILLDAHAGHIIDAFGNFVAGGSLVVGIVVFVIITLVQFMVIAKGAERVAEVAARFTLDAMPGKQMSIDSDLRSGLLDKDEARRRRSLLERESQLGGALDGAMKFVKGDSIASIIIVIVNLLGGLTIGILQKGMNAGDAMQLYSILSIGDGMVAQIPALLSAMAAGLIVTRSSGNDKDSHLGETIGRQIIAHPRALTMTGFISLMFAVVPGFPTLIFIGLAAGAFVLAYYAKSVAGSESSDASEFRHSGTTGSNSDAPPKTVAAPARAGLAQPLVIELAAAGESFDIAALEQRLGAVVARNAMALGLRLPAPACVAVPETAAAWQILIFDVPVAVAAAGSTADPETIERELNRTLLRHADQFIGVQEVCSLLDAAAEQYPALVKEVLRQLPSAQKIAEVMRNLVREGIPLRNLRDVLEALAEWGSREKDSGALTEFVRIHLKRYMTNRFTDAQHRIEALVVDGAAEELVRRGLTETAGGMILTLSPQLIAALRTSLRGELDRLGVKESPEHKAPLLLTAADVRRHIYKILEPIHRGMSVLSYQELLPDVEVKPLGTVRFETGAA